MIQMEFIFCFIAIRFTIVFLKIYKFLLFLDKTNGAKLQKFCLLTLHSNCWVALLITRLANIEQIIYSAQIMENAFIDYVRQSIFMMCLVE